MYIDYVPVKDILVITNIRDSDPDDASIQSLAESMSFNGQHVEIRVYPIGDKYGLIVGHRRLAAARLLEWEYIRAIIEDVPGDEVGLIIQQYNENENRDNLSYIEKAWVYARLKNAGMSQHRIAEITGTNDADVSLALASLKAPEKIQQAINDGRISPSAVEPILSLHPNDQEELAAAVIQAKTVRNVKKLVDAHRASKHVGKSKGVLNTNVPDDADPLELISISAIEEAINYLKSAEETPITSPKLVRAVRPRVEELIRTASRLKRYLDGETWADTKDLY
jgi:ParB family chromosome partitioning protein